MENNYVYASVQIKQPCSITIRSSPRRQSSSPSAPSFIHLRLSFSYNVRHYLVHQPEDPELPSTFLRGYCNAAVKHTAWLGTAAAFNNRPQPLYSKVAAIFTKLGVEEKSHRRLFDQLVVDIRRVAASVSPKLMILPLRVVVVRDHLILVSDEEGEKKSGCVVDDQKKGSVVADKKEKVQKSRRRRRRKYY